MQFSKLQNFLQIAPIKQNEIKEMNFKNFHP